MTAGELNRTVILRQPTSLRVDGSKETTYADFLTVRANIKRTNSFRALEANATALLNTDTVTIRNAANRAGLTEDWQVKFDGVDHTVTSIDRGDTYLTMIVKSKNG